MGAGRGVAFEVGDVVEGRFSCLVDQISARGIVRSRIPDADGRGRGGFNADSIDYVHGKGYGLWGFDDEVRSARRASEADEAAAAEVKARVRRSTDLLLGPR